MADYKKGEVKDDKGKETPTYSVGTVFHTLFCVLHVLSFSSRILVAVSIWFGEDETIPTIFEIVYLVLLPMSLFTFHFADSTFLIKFACCGAIPNILYLIFVLIMSEMLDISKMVFYIINFDWVFGKYLVFGIVDFVFISTLVFLNCSRVRIHFDQKNLFTILVAYLPLLTTFIPYFKVMVEELMVNEFFMFLVGLIYFINNHKPSDYNICVSMCFVIFVFIAVSNVVLYFITIQMNRDPIALDISQGITIWVYVHYFSFVLWVIIKNARSVTILFSGERKGTEKSLQTILDVPIAISINAADDINVSSGGIDFSVPQLSKDDSEVYGIDGPKYTYGDGVGIPGRGIVRRGGGTKKKKMSLRRKNSTDEEHEDDGEDEDPKRFEDDEENEDSDEKKDRKSENSPLLKSNKDE